MTVIAIWMNDNDSILSAHEIHKSEQKKNVIELWMECDREFFYGNVAWTLFVIAYQLDEPIVIVLNKSLIDHISFK